MSEKEDKKEEFVRTEETDKKEEDKKKKMKKKWRVKQNGRWFKIDKSCIKESETLRTWYGTTYYNSRTLNIRRTSILKMALRFCKKRGHIKTIYANDENLLRMMLKKFDSKFLKQMKENHTDDDLIDLIDAASKLDIKSLFEMLFDDVVDIMSNRKTLEEIEKIFTKRLKDDDDDDELLIMTTDSATDIWKRLLV